MNFSKNDIKIIFYQIKLQEIDLGTNECSFQIDCKAFSETIKNFNDIFFSFIIKSENNFNFSGFVDQSFDILEDDDISDGGFLKKKALKIIKEIIISKLSEKNSVKYFIENFFDMKKLFDFEQLNFCRNSENDYYIKTSYFKTVFSYRPEEKKLFLVDLFLNKTGVEDHFNDEFFDKNCFFDYDLYEIKSDKGLANKNLESKIENQIFSFLEDTLEIEFNFFKNSKNLKLKTLF